MNALVGLIFVFLSEKYQKKWKLEKEKRDWEKWEEGEEMRREMGYTVDIVKIPRHGGPPRKKHRH